MKARIILTAILLMAAGVMTRAESTISLSAYAGTVIIADGQTLTDGSALYTDTLNDGQKAYIAGKTLRRAPDDVSYIDENGQVQTCSDYTLLSDPAILVDGTIGTDDQDTWYVAAGDYTLDHNGLVALGHVHLILCDDATFTVSGSDYGIMASSLTIYGQSVGTGRLVASAYDESNADGAIIHSDALTINGGSVSTSSVSGGGIMGGSSRSSLTINGGIVNAAGADYGIYSNGEITLGWTRSTDSIYASKYSGYATIRIKKGQAFSNGTETLSGTITDLSILSGKTLVPITIDVAYIDTDGSTKYCTEYTLITSDRYEYGTSGVEAWYVVSGDVEISDFLQFNGNANIILCDGSHLNCPDGYIVNNANLCIYAQSGGTGRIDVSFSAMGEAILVDDFTLNGGIVNAICTTTWSAGYGIHASGSVTINGGGLTATCPAAEDGYGILAYGNIVINGGNVTASGSSSGITGASANSTITLGWSKPTDSIYASKYVATSISVKSGQAFTDGTNTYTNSLNSDQIYDMAGKTLRPLPMGGDASASLMAHQATLEGESCYWASFYHASWNYRLPEGAQAFIMKSNQALYRIGDGTIIPAGCAVVIMADKSALTLTATTDAPMGVSEGLLEANVLRGLSTNTAKNSVITPGQKVYVLSHASAALFFRPLNGNIVPAHKAFYVK